MNNLILGFLVYNEEHRFLKEFLDKMSQLTNKIVAVDDGSTDNSISICSKYTSNIYQTDRLMTKNESILRQTLWDKCTQLCNNGDYILNNLVEPIPIINKLPFSLDELKNNIFKIKSYDIE